MSLHSPDRLKSDVAISEAFDALAESYSIGDPLHDAIRDIDFSWSTGEIDVPSHLEFDQIEDWLLGRAVMKSLDQEQLHA